MRTSIALIVLLIAFPGGGAPPTNDERPVLRLTSDDGAPYTQADGNGTCDRLLRNACEKLGYTVKIECRPSERALKDVDQGMDDGNFLRILGISSKYANLRIVPEKLTDFDFVAFSKAQDLPITQWEDLRSYRVGYVIGWKIVEDNICGLPEVKGVRDGDILFSMLEKGRIDVAIYSKAGGEYICSQSHADDIHPVGKPLAVREMYLYLHRKHETLIEPLAEALRVVKSTVPKEEQRP